MLTSAHRTSEAVFPRAARPADLGRSRRPRMRWTAQSGFVFAPPTPDPEPTSMARPRTGEAWGHDLAPGCAGAPGHRRLRRHCRDRRPGPWARPTVVPSSRGRFRHRLVISYAVAGTEVGDSGSTSPFVMTMAKSEQRHHRSACVVQFLRTFFAFAASVTSAVGDCRRRESPNRPMPIGGGATASGVHALRPHVTIDGST